jgi:hypothetical protein
LLLLPFPSDVQERRRWRLLQFGGFQSEIEAILPRRFQEELGDIGYRDRLATTVGDELPLQFKEFS